MARSGKVIIPLSARALEGSGARRDAHGCSRRVCSVRSETEGSLLVRGQRGDNPPALAASLLQRPLPSLAACLLHPWCQPRSTGGAGAAQAPRRLPGLAPSRHGHLPAGQGSPVAIPAALGRPHPAEQREQSSLCTSSLWVHPCPVHGEARWLRPAASRVVPAVRQRVGCRGHLRGAACVGPAPFLPAREPGQGGAWMAASPEAVGCSQPRGGGGCGASLGFLQAAPQRALGMTALVKGCRGGLRCSSSSHCNPH